MQWIANDRAIGPTVAGIANQLRVPDANARLPWLLGSKDAHQRANLAVVGSQPEVFNKRVEHLLFRRKVTQIAYTQRFPVEPTDTAGTIAPGHFRPIGQFSIGVPVGSLLLDLG